MLSNHKPSKPTTYVHGKKDVHPNVVNILLSSIEGHGNIKKKYINIKSSCRNMYKS